MLDNQENHKGVGRIKYKLEMYAYKDAITAIYGLEDRVNELIKIGWMPVGGVLQVIPDTNQPANNTYEYLFIQAMIKKD